MLAFLDGLYKNRQQWIEKQAPPPPLAYVDVIVGIFQWRKQTLSLIKSEEFVEKTFAEHSANHIGGCDMPQNKFRLPSYMIFSL